MSGIYIHIPFCKQACHYCDFHFSTSMAKKDAMIVALKNELLLRKDEFTNQHIATIYFGGGTPSVLTTNEINELIEVVYANYSVIDSPEITLEANPDDLTNEKIAALAKSPINRLSIGVQSFFEEDLRLMNRAHNAQEAENCIVEAKKYFDNISIDLIYGMPNMSNARWQKNIQKALDLAVPHISSYALTVEPKTALASFIKKGKMAPLNEAVAQEHFSILNKILAKNGFVGYEISNFGKPGYFSKNNTAYWQQKKYIGIGPSAHSFDGQKRGWNIANNSKYIAAITKGELALETEELTKMDRYNEYVMTGLRTIWGISITYIAETFGSEYGEYVQKHALKFINQNLLVQQQDTLKATEKGKFLIDGIASDLFIVKN